MLFTMNYTNAFSDENSYIYLSLWKEELFLYEKEKIHPTDLMGVYAELAELIGIDSTVEIYEHFKGQHVWGEFA